jgi:hypothetical protein
MLRQGKPAKKLGKSLRGKNKTGINPLLKQNIRLFERLSEHGSL